MNEVWWRLRSWATARHLTQTAVILVVVWLVVIGTDYLKLTDPTSLELTAIKSNVAAFGLLLTLPFHFLYRDRTSLAIVALTLVALAWFQLTAGSGLPAWMGLDWLFPAH